MSFFSLLAVLPSEQMRSLLVWSGHVLVRHVTMGRGQSAHYYTGIRQALSVPLSWRGAVIEKSAT
jgi:hypothetical protein